MGVHRKFTISFSNNSASIRILNTASMIRPYIDRDPTKFCTSEEFETGVRTISQFIELRGQAVANQLAGDNTPLAVNQLNTSDMGSMDTSPMGDKPDATTPPASNAPASDASAFDASAFDASAPTVFPDPPSDFSQAPGGDMQNAPNESQESFPVAQLGISLLVLMPGIIIAIRKK